MLAARRRSEVGARPGSRGRLAPRRVRAARWRRAASGPSAQRSGDASPRREVGEIAAVGPDRRGRQAALDPQVGQVVLDRPLERRRAGRHGHGTGAAAGISRRPRTAPATPRPARAARGRTPGPRAGRASAGPSAVVSTRRASGRARRSGPRDRAGSTSVTVRPSRSRFAIWKWASAWAAICGRWVTHRTWCRRPRLHRLRPTGSALRPPIPVSISSNTRRRRVVDLGEDLLDREGDPAQLAARRDLRERAAPARRRSARSGTRPGRCPDASNATASPSTSTAASSRPAGRRPRPTSKTSGGKPSSASDPPDVLGEGPAGRCPGRRQVRRRRGDPLEEPGVVGLAGRPLVVDAAQPLRLGGRPLAVGDDRRLVVAEAALEAVDRRQPVGQPGQLRGIVIDRLGQLADGRRHVVELGLETGEPLGDLGEALVEPGERARLVERDARRHRGRRAPRRPSASTRVALPRAIASPCCAASSRVRISSASPGRRLAAAISFASCSASSSRRVSSRGSSSSVGEERPVLAPALDRGRHRGPERRVAAERVEQVALPALVEEPLLVVLAVDLDERAGDLGEPGGRHRLVVEARRRSAGRRHLAGRDQRLRQAIEQRGDARGLRAVPDEGRVRARPDRQPERVDQQALAGAGLAGEHVQARAPARAAAARSGRGP